MADFMTNLWNAVFEAGPTPTLLIATNASFGALQIVLLALLVATHSIHFVILSVLCAGLWLSINWFANEVRAVQAAEQQAIAKDNLTAGGADADSSSSSRSATATFTNTSHENVERKRLQQRNSKRSADHNDNDNDNDAEWEKIES